jgi:uncharacterized membrane protein
MATGVEVRGLWRHWRLVVAILAGLAALAAARGVPAPVSTHVLIGWDFGALVYIGLLWRLFMTAKGPDVRRRAALEDEGPSLLLVIVLAAILASLGAVTAAMIHARSTSVETRGLTAAFAVLTLILSWTVLQSVFVLHYAHRHFGDGSATAGFGFPGEPPTTYRDFIYLAFGIGTTFQVADNEVRTSRLRNLVIAHAVTAYFYNTALLALGINIIAGVVSA